MLVSVIVPIFNAEKFLTRCLDSIALQSFTDWECLLIDDGSIDSSGCICDEYASKDSRFKVFHKDNKGVSSARNYGIDIAKGDFMCFVDADDWISENFLSGLVEYAQYPLVIGGYHRFGMSDEIFYAEKGVVNVVQDLGATWNVNSLNGWLFWYVWGKLFKTSIIKEQCIRFNVNMKYNEDNCFVIEYLCKIRNFVFAGTADYMYYFPKTSRLDKYKFSFDEYQAHCKTQNHILCQLENIVSVNFFKVRSNVYRRFYLSFINNLFSIDSFKQFQNQNLCFKTICGESMASVTDRYKMIYKLFNFIPTPMLFLMRKFWKYFLTIFLSMEAFVSKLIRA